MNIIQLIKSDLFRIKGKVDIKTYLMASFLNTGFKYTFWLRAHKSQYRLIRFISRIFLSIKSRQYQIQISRNADIGYGFFINHGMCVVIAGSVKIGNNCTVSQFLTIGSMHNSAAVIGDNVYIGPNVCIVEDVKIGNNVTIGAGAVVVKDIPDNVTVAGVPAKIISENTPGRLVYNRWKI